MKRWGFDLDEIVCDISTSMVAFTNQYFGTNIALEDLTDYYIYNALGISAEEFQPILDLAWRPEILLGLPIILDGRTMVNKIRDIGCSTVFITSRASSINEITRIWLEKNDIGFDDVFTTNLGSKTALVKELQLDYFVEDNPKHAIAIADIVAKVFVPEYPWNRNMIVTENIIKIKQCSQILDMIDETGTIK